MANLGEDFDTKSLINSLNLDSFYPEKLTREHLYEITELSLEKKETFTQETIAWYFLNRLTRLNYNARSIKLQRAKVARSADKAKPREIHPLDILIAVFLCCDPIAKQDFVKYLWDCKLAVPFILRPDNSSSLTVYNWPLKHLVSKCKEKEHKLPTEFLIYEKPMQKVGFIRLCNDNESKSNLINGIIGGPEKTHPIFFHRNLQGSKKTRSNTVDGLVEIGWYFPKGSETDVFEQPLTFANLRGDILRNREHVPLLCDFLNIIVIISKFKHFKKNPDIIEEIINSNVVPILVITDQDMEDEDLEDVNDFRNQITGTYKVILFNDCMLPEKLERITEQLKQSLLHANTEGIDMFCERQSNGDTCTVYDNLVPIFQRGIKFSETIIKEILAIEENKRTRSILPLQGELWKKWTETEIEKHRLEIFLNSDAKEKTDTITYRDNLESQKQNYRQQQFDIIESSLSVVMQKFMLAYLCLNEDEFPIFLRSFIIGLDTISRKAMQPYLYKYNEILDQKTKAKPTEIDAFNKQIDALDAENTMKLFGIEHIIRELGQIFESCSSLEGDTFEIQLSDEYQLPCSEIPAIAANILLLGYPIEIMDGDVGFIPELFVRAILNKVQTQLKNRDGKNTIVHVFSVLGLQSSGKSTLLNTMFGLKFSVGSGRCTKGVFMQMVKVANACWERVKCDYLIVLDTEGIKASKRNTPRWEEYEQELSCFAIGMADTTIINIMGENIQYLKDDLPIAVHAFLRMETIGLKSRGAIFYHNVAKTNHDKLMEQGHELEKILNSLTASACKLELIEPPKCFREIIDLDAAGETNYIPSLLDGELPMAAISVGYSNECNDLRKMLIEHIHKNSRKLSILEFVNHLVCLWSAIKTEKLVFHFKSISELQSKIYGDEMFWRLYRNLWKDKSLLVQNYHEKMCKYSKEEAEEEIRRTIDTLKTCFSQRQSEIEHDMSNLSLTANTIEKFKDGLLHKLQIAFDELSIECSEEINTIYENKYRNININEGNTVRSEDKEYLEKMILSNKCEDIITVWNEFKSHWILKQRPLLEKKIRLARVDSERVLYDMFSQYHSAIFASLEEKQNDLSKFVIKKEHIKIDYKPVETRTICQADEPDCIIITKKVIESTDEKLNQIKEDMHKNHCETVKVTLMNMKELTNGLKRKCTNKYFADLSVAVMRHTFDFISKQTEIESYLERQKGKYMSFISSILNIKKTESIQSLSEEAFHLLMDLILKNAVQVVTKRPLLLKYKSKVALVKSLIKQSLQDDDMKMMKEYHANPRSALKEYVKANITVVDFVGGVQSVAVQKLQTLTETIASLKPDDLKNDDFLNLWVTDVAVNSKISVTKDDFNLSQNLKVRRNLLETSQHVLKLLKEYGDEKMKSVTKLTTDKEFIIFKENASQDYIKRIIGCCEQCPFCSEICQNSLSNHDGSHEAITHRPVRYGTIHKSYHATCGDMLDETLKISFQSSGRKVLVKDYKSVYDDWQISRSCNTESLAKVWKWYYAQTQPDTEVPQTWKIKKSVVISELEKD